MAAELERWPETGYALLHELANARGRVALVAGSGPAVDRLVDRLQQELGVSSVSVGAALADWAHPPTAAEIEAVCGDATVLTDLDVLLWPAIHVPALPFIIRRGRHRPTIAVWPGYIANGRATYSAPGRPDHRDAALRNTIVLHARTTRFPDEVPFRIERILP